MKSVSKGLWVALITTFLFANAQAAKSSRYGFEVKDVETRELVKAALAQNQYKASWLLSKTFIGLEVLTGASSKVRLESLFGHTLIRLLDGDADPLNDTVLGFEMLIMDENLSEVYRKGYEGKSAVMLTVKTLSEIMVTYNIVEQRKLTRTIVPMTSKGLENIKAMAADIVTNPIFAGSYGYFSNNCATLALSLFAEAGIRIERGFADVPTSISSRLVRGGYIPYPSLVVPTAGDFIKEHAKLAKFMSKDQILEKDSAEFWKEVSQLSDEDIEFLFHVWPLKWSNTKGVMAELFKAKVKNPRRLNQVLKLTILPQAIYKSCDPSDVVCRRLRAEAASQLWSKQALIKNIDFRRKHINAERQRAEQLIDFKKIELLEMANSPLVVDHLLLADDLRALP